MLERPLLSLLLMCLLLAGCASRSGITFQNAEGFHRMPEGSVAILSVRAPHSETQKSYKFLWGAPHPSEPRRAFAEILAHVAREEGNLDVLPPTEVRRRLESEGIEPRLAGDLATAERLARSLGCSSYLTARVRCWRSVYILTSQKAKIDFQITCRLPGRKQPLWSARVRDQKRSASSHEVAIQTLRNMFTKLRWKTNSGSE